MSGVCVRGENDADAGKENGADGCTRTRRAETQQQATGNNRRNTSDRQPDMDCNKCSPYNGEQSARSPSQNVLREDAALRGKMQRFLLSASCKRLSCQRDAFSLLSLLSPPPAIVPSAPQVKPI